MMEELLQERDELRKEVTRLATMAERQRQELARFHAQANANKFLNDSLDRALVMIGGPK